ncbi:GP28.1 [Caviid betaherpesvirus 2]|uniref:GP28.1 n=1 Tax=Guinea pig cytomegalovirus (strain 22122) TaxID=103920 RepID=E9RH43_GPCMV|nr:GP28.1 [Caviid betaherpesvirus 2]AGE11505.1 GP28.1 [Caviid betaherpesvirus 2]AIL83893.1 GP28.1 [BAC cloning vector GPN13BACdenovo_preserved(MM)]BAJ78495.1 GP28.1 [Caviid betaherpesvirus 2]
MSLPEHLDSTYAHAILDAGITDTSIFLAMAENAGTARRTPRSAFNYVKVSESSLVHIMSMFDKWEAGSLERPRNKLLHFVQKHSGERILLAWPPLFSVELGSQRRFEISGYVARLRKFAPVKICTWFCFIGVVCECDREGNRDDLWVIATDDGRIIGYDPSADLVYVFGRKLTEFISASLRNVSRYYQIPFRGSVYEQACFGYEPVGITSLILSTDMYSLDVMSLALTNRGTIFEDASGQFAFIMGDAAFFSTSDTVPKCVLESLHQSGFHLIGITTELNRLVLVARDESGIYVQGPNCCVIKVADTLKEFIRRRLSPLKQACEKSYISDKGRSTSYIPVGKQIGYSCAELYKFPGDDEILNQWTGGRLYSYTSVSEMLDVGRDVTETESVTDSTEQNVVETEEEEATGSAERDISETAEGATGSAEQDVAETQSATDSVEQDAAESENATDPAEQDVAETENVTDSADRMN